MLWKQKTFAWGSGIALAGLGLALAARAAEVSSLNAARLIDVSTTTASIGGVAMTRYKNKDWNFALDIPARWNAFPPVPTNSPYEVIRFSSRENGDHGLIVFRVPDNPAVSPEVNAQRVQEALAKNGSSHFVRGAIMIGSRKVLTLDFDQPAPNGKTLSCRQFYIIDGTLQYVLGFGTTDRNAMFGLYDRMAKSFVFGQAPG